MNRSNPIIPLIRPAVVVFLLLTIVTGVAYPLAMIALARVLPAPPPETLVGQSFSEPHFFWGRLSATSPVPYTAFDKNGLSGSSGSNLAPSNPALIAAAQARIDALTKAAASVGLAVLPETRTPVDLVTASASGLDPHLSLAGVEFQLERVARARGMDEAQLRELVHRATARRQLGILGEPVVNIAALNRSLEREAPLRRP